MRKWFSPALIIAAFIASAWLYPRLPDRVPTHWNLHGDVDGYGGRLEAVFLLPLAVLGVWLLLRWLPRIDPRRENWEKFWPTFEIALNTIVTVLLVIHFVVLASAMGAPLRINQVITLVTGVALAVVGNLLPRARPNWWFGIRTPWTLSNDRVWERTHRLGGYVMMVGGLALAFASLLPVTITPPLIAVVLAAVGVWAMVYSYVAWRQETSR